MGRVGDVGSVKGEVVIWSGCRGYTRRSSNVPAGATRRRSPGEGAHYHHSAPVLVVGQHVTHRYGVVPRGIGEGEYDVVLL